MAQEYTIFNHTADLGIEVYGQDQRSLFINAGHALFELITDLVKVEAKDSLPLTVEALDLEDLMVSWLRELLYLHQSEGYLLKSFTFNELGEHSLTAIVKGEKYDMHRHELLREIKAVTYHQIKVVQDKDRWIARIVLDI